jgi:hypothetical protein
LPLLADAMRAHHPKTVKTDITSQYLSPHYQLTPHVLLDLVSIYSSFGLCSHTLSYLLHLRPLCFTPFLCFTQSALWSALQPLPTVAPFPSLTHVPTIVPQHFIHFLHSLWLPTTLFPTTPYSLLPENTLICQSLLHPSFSRS